MCPQLAELQKLHRTGTHAGVSKVSQAGQRQDPQRPQGDFLIRSFFPSQSVLCPIT